MNLTIGDLFSGIGMLGFGVARAFDARHLYFVEKEPFCQSVLRRHFPDVPIFEDVRDVATPAKPLPRTDIICGGFPCQSVSVAGLGKGLADVARSGLWFEYARIVRVQRPHIVIVENVPGLRTRGLDTVVGDLSDAGYDVAWDILSAAHVGTPHLRRRFFIVAWQPAFADANRRELRDLFERLSGGWTRRLRGSGQAFVGDDGEGRIVDGVAPDADGAGPERETTERRDRSWIETADRSDGSARDERDVADAAGPRRAGSTGSGNASEGRATHGSPFRRARVDVADTDGGRRQEQRESLVERQGARGSIADGRSGQGPDAPDTNGGGGGGGGARSGPRQDGGGVDEPRDRSEWFSFDWRSAPAPIRLASTEFRRMDDGDSEKMDRPLERRRLRQINLLAPLRKRALTAEYIKGQHERRARRPKNDRPRLAALGNSVLWPCAYVAAMWAIKMMVQTEFPPRRGGSHAAESSA